MPTLAAADQEAADFAFDFARRLALHLDAQLASRPLGIYLMGSLAHGGFSRRYSDIDIALVTEQGLSQDALDALNTEATLLSPDLAPKISLFWSDRHFSTGRFLPLDRIDYLDHALPLVENERALPSRPPLKEVRAYLGGAPFTKWADSTRHFSALGALDVRDHKSYLRTLLYPARFIYSWITGCMASNDDAVALLQEQRPQRLNIHLLAEALECRRAARDPDYLFPDRGLLPQQVDACRKLMA